MSYRPPPALRTAYEAAEYFVGPPLEIGLRVGIPCPALGAHLAAEGLGGGALITAHNPRSRPTPAADNLRAHEDLRAAIEALGMVVIAGEGRDPTGQWPAEPSWFVAGIDETVAYALAERFDQHAFLWIDALGTPALRWVPEAPGDPV